MDRLTMDPRTESIGGDRNSRRQLLKVVDRLFAELRPVESASWVALSAGMSPALAVITNQRLIALPLPLSQPVRSAAAPFVVRLGKSRLVGQSVEVVDSGGSTVKLLLSPSDLEKVQAAAGMTPSFPPRPSGPQYQSNAAPSSPSPPPPGSVGAWNWGRPIFTWQDAEQMAAAHLTYLGFRGVIVTPGTGDGGLDAVADGAAAQVKLHAVPTGSPDIQRLYGAASGFPNRLFYATAYTTAGTAEAERLHIGLFQFAADGLVVAINANARQIAPSAPAPEQRGFLGNLTFESRQNRAIRWAQQIEAATQVPVSNSQRKGAKQLVAREKALTLMVRGLEELKDSDNPLYKQLRKERTLSQAEKTLKEAALTVLVRLK